MVGQQWLARFATCKTPVRVGRARTPGNFYDHGAASGNGADLHDRYGCCRTADDPVPNDRRRALPSTQRRRRILTMKSLLSPQTVSSTPVRAALQAKLAVNTPGDAYEQEADAMADQVMRKCDHCEKEEETIQRK